VRDEGFGLPHLSTAQLFEPFFTTRPLATGLGLTAAALTVRALKGWMYVEHGTPRGTSVHVLIPRAGAHATPPPART
jgi:C4-dicarboxylate-specific signal transduction histidine kinase